ncbi:hypothetical protein PHLCEN_2v12832 [Hermanssonia centrifuga]|uniref:Uncharacterized protein n=1 Tax=Hermanssonia centrifuga TaxID=98765 RepID=A0A2R6NGD7_9APHY|nr:hypothetical protein PHLCEN_2v12832 [Hermanssonia centrifuga]
MVDTVQLPDGHEQDLSQPCFDRILHAYTKANMYTGTPWMVTSEGKDSSGSPFEHVSLAL